MPRVVMPPIFERREREDSADVANETIDIAIREERSVAAIVEEDEGAHQQPRRDHGEREGKPVWNAASQHP